MKSLYEHEAEVTATENFGDNRTMLTSLMPLRELMRNFFDEVKSISSGYASISYDITENRPADVVRMDVLVADEPVVAFSRVVSRRRVTEEAESACSALGCTTSLSSGHAGRRMPWTKPQPSSGQSNCRATHFSGTR